MLPSCSSLLLSWSPVVPVAVTTLSGAAAADELVVSGRWRLMCPPSACPDANTAPHDEHSCAGLVAAAAVRRLSVVVTAAAAASSGRRGGGGCCFLSLLWLVRWPPRAWKEGKHLLHVLHSYDTHTPPPASAAALRLVLFGLLGGAGAGITLAGSTAAAAGGPWARRMRHLAMSSSSSSSFCVVVLLLCEEEDEAAGDEQWCRRRLLLRCGFSLATEAQETMMAPPVEVE